MADVRPFICCRPKAELAAELAALPYDVFSREEAAAEIEKHPRSFLRIDKSWAVLPDDVGEYDAQVYEKAAELFTADLRDGVFINEGEEHYFIYRLARGEQAQTGIVSCIAVRDFESSVLKRHENTRSFKLEDRVNHIRALQAHTGPIFVAHRHIEALEAAKVQVLETAAPLYDFYAPDGVRHTVWRVDEQETGSTIRNCFVALNSLYIVDGHHRASAAVKVSRERGEEDGCFLIVAFPAEQLRLLDYNRVVFDTNGLSKAELLEQIAAFFTVERLTVDHVKPTQKGEFAMYAEGEWYRLTVNEDLRPDDTVASLDVSLLHDLLLEPILGIDDPKSSDRISFVSGVRGLEGLRRRADETRSDSAPQSGIAFALYPCAMEELFEVADEGRLMPPKSTWFEPKPRSGLFIHAF